MNCPKCGSENIRVVDTINGLQNDIYRRRKCSDCKSTFRTVEIVGGESRIFNTGYSAAIEKREKRRTR